MQERRLHPRYSIAWAVKLGREDSGWHRAETSSISATGFDLSVTRDAVVALARLGNQLITPGDHIDIRFTEGDGRPDTALSYEVMIKQVRRVSQDRYIVGGEFADMSEEQSNALHVAVEQLAQRLRH